MPTSTNVIWRKGKGRTYLNPKYVAWKEEATAELLRQHGTVLPHPGWFDVTIVVSDKKRGKMDLDNRVKAILDWAQKAGVVENDKYVDSLNMSWGKASSGVRVTFRFHESP